MTAGARRLRRFARTIAPRHAHDFARRIENAASDLLGWSCLVGTCTASRSVAQAQALATAAHARDVEARRRRAEKAEARARRVELVEFVCEGATRGGCGVRIRLPRWQAERKCYCCDPCRRRCWRRQNDPPPPCASCAARSEAA